MVVDHQNFHEVNIQHIDPGEYHVVCMNRECLFSETATTNFDAKQLAWKHVRQLIAEET